MQHMPRKIRSAAIAFLFLGGSVVTLLFVSHVVTTKGDALGERMQLIADERAFEQQYSELAATVRETAAERELLEAAVLRDDRDTIELLSLLDSIAAAQGVTLTTSGLNETQTAGRFNTLSLNYKISGSGKAVTRMLKLLETLPYHGHITSVSVRRSTEGETGTPQMTADISLSLSIQKND